MAVVGLITIIVGAVCAAALTIEGIDAAGAWMLVAAGFGLCAAEGIAAILGPRRGGGQSP